MFVTKNSINYNETRPNPDCDSICPLWYVTNSSSFRYRQSLKLEYTTPHNRTKMNHQSWCSLHTLTKWDVSWTLTSPEVATVFRSAHAGEKIYWFLCTPACPTSAVSSDLSTVPFATSRDELISAPEMYQRGEGDSWLGQYWYSLVCPTTLPLLTFPVKVLRKRVWTVQFY